MIDRGIALLLGFFLFPVAVLLFNAANEAWTEWHYRKVHYKKCPMCGTYVLNLKAPAESPTSRPEREKG